MATIRPRRRRDGTLAYPAEPGSLLTRKRREVHGAFRRVLEKYREAVSDLRATGRSKNAHIKFLEKTPLADIDTEEIKSADLIQHVRNRRKSRTRSRRTTQAEPKVLTGYFRKKRRSTIPMSDILWFAIHSARFQTIDPGWYAQTKNRQCEWLPPRLRVSRLQYCFFALATFTDLILGLRCTDTRAM